MGACMDGTDSQMGGWMVRIDVGLDGCPGGCIDRMDGQVGSWLDESL